MEKFKVENITFYSSSVLEEKEIAKVLELIKDRYRDLDLEIYLYGRNKFEHINFILKKFGVLQLMKSMFKKFYNIENNGFYNYYKTDKYLNVFEYNHKKLLKKEVKYKIKKLSTKLKYKEKAVEYFADNFTKFNSIYAVILVLELARIKKYKYIDINDKSSYRWMEDIKDLRKANEKVDEIISENIKNILSITECKGVEVILLDGGKIDVDYTIYTPLLDDFKYKINIKLDLIKR